MVSSQDSSTLSLYSGCTSSFFTHSTSLAILYYLKIACALSFSCLLSSGICPPLLPPPLHQPPPSPMPPPLWSCLRPSIWQALFSGQVGRSICMSESLILLKCALKLVASKSTFKVFISRQYSAYRCMPLCAGKRCFTMKSSFFSFSACTTTYCDLFFH